jgi:hypothetical protein
MTGLGKSRSLRGTTFLLIRVVARTTSKRTHLRQLEEEFGKRFATAVAVTLASTESDEEGRTTWLQEGCRADKIIP